MKINFINPFGTPAYDALIVETLVPYARADTELVVTNIKDGPPNIDFYYSKHILELRIFEEVMRAEEQGFDAVIVGCCYDPGVRAARELVDIPVIGPLGLPSISRPTMATTTSSLRTTIRRCPICGIWCTSMEAGIAGASARSTGG